MKKLFAILSLFFVGYIFFWISAQEIESDTYKIEGFSVTGGGGVLESGVEGKYTVFSAIGESFADERLESSSYSMDLGSKNTIQANVPLINCFVTGLEDTTSCDNAAFANGLEALCGDGGCFDRAYFEIDAQDNPSDTLYGIQIKKSTDTQWSYVDGTTNLIETDSSRNLDDYKTKNDWESLNFNILGIESGVTYQLRATALNGDFTESIPGPSVNASTTSPVIFFDIDIAGEVWQASNAPYQLNFGDLLVGVVSSASNKVWVNIGSNSPMGSKISSKSSNGGFVQVGGDNYKIVQIDSADLSIEREGMGAKSTTEDQAYLGPLIALSPFDGVGDFAVGAISSENWVDVYSTSGDPVSKGLASLEIMIKPDLIAPAGRYSEELIFVAYATF